jgi:opacity protein-like surface antigen
MRARLILAVPLLLLSASSAFAQRVEVQPFIGSRFGGGFTVDQTIPGGSRPVDVTFGSGFTWGSTLGVDVSPQIQVEFLWSRQKSEISYEAPAVPKTKLFDASVAQYHGDVLWHFGAPERKVRPYMLVGLGATNIDPDQEGQKGATKFSFGLGGGVKGYFNKHAGVRAQLRWTPTYVSTQTQLWCDLFGFCYAVNTADYMNQGEFTVGAIFRF